MTRLLYVGIGAAGTVCALFVLAAGCALAELLFGGRVDAALADTGDFDTHVDQALALTQPCGCGPMCPVHESAYSRWRANLGLPEVWTDETDRELRRLLDGAA